MASLLLKIKTKTEQKVVKELTSESTVKELKTVLSSMFNIPANKMQIMSGFPPKALDLSSEDKIIKDTGIASGDILILEEKSGEDPPQPQPQPSGVQVSVNEPRPHVQDNDVDCPGILMKHVVPADNSCLFTSIYYVLNGKDDTTGGVAHWMRQLIAETVSRNQDEYSEAILGKPNDVYCRWIQDSNSWGGAIELAILSNYYGIEIAVVDTINAIINRFGEDQDYPHRVLLMFDGIHYDPLYLEPLEGGNIRTIFDKSDERILREAEQLAKEANSSRQFTDVTKFVLKCLECNVQLNGQIAAQQHAKTTGHRSFGEI